MSAFLREYATATTICIPIIKRASVDFAVGSNWTPVAGDVKVLIDDADPVDILTLPEAVEMGNTAVWLFSLAVAELTGKKITVTVSDAAIKAVEDQCFLVETFGHVNAQYETDFNAIANLNNQALILAKVNLLESGVRPTIFLTVRGDHIYVFRGDSPTIPLEDLGDISDREESWFTVKKAHSDSDDQAILKIRESDGLLRARGMVPTDEQTGEIDVIDDVNGNVNITYSAAVAAILPDTNLVYDYKVKRVGASGPVTLRNGVFHVTADVTNSAE